MPMADSAWAPGVAADFSSNTGTVRHSAMVRVTHWITTICFFALLVTGIEIVISHPRFYWGEYGNVLTPTLFSIPIPASRATVPTGYGYVLPDQNGWSRSLHFQAAWAAVFIGLLYFVWGLFSGHFRRNLVPNAADGGSLLGEIGEHLRFKKPDAGEAWSYNTVQRLAYLGLIFVLGPGRWRFSAASNRRVRFTFLERCSWSCSCWCTL